MINYCIQVILFQVLFLAIYDVFLSKETFFSKNRFYLLATPIASFLLPFVKIPTFQKAVPEEFIIYLPEVVLSPEKVIQKTTWYQSINYIDVFFWFGVGLFSLLFIIKLFKIFTLIIRYKVHRKTNYSLVVLPNANKAFSFFNYIFLGNDISETQKEKIIQHELVHSQQKHSIDLLFFELLKIIMWFNPLLYIYQKRITLIHEYISDNIVSKETHKENYINNILSNFFQVENISFINQFYKHSFIKKRIIMMTKKQSKKMNQLKYLLLIPVLVSMLFYTSCSKTELKEDTPLSEKTQLQEMIAINQKLKDSIDILNSKMKSFEKFTPNKNGEITEVEEVSFMSIDKAPTYPGCESGDKKCFSKMVQKHFATNFDTKLPNQLGLEKGKKRIFIGFKIDIQGNVVDVKARAPHKKITTEVVRVMNSLPKMIPGEHKSEKVAVKYSIPFTLLIEE